MLFGTFYNLGAAEGSTALTISRGFDNFSVSVSAVTENGMLALSLLGLLPVLGAVRRRRAAQGM